MRCQNLGMPPDRNSTLTALSFSGEQGPEMVPVHLSSLHFAQKQKPFEMSPSDCSSPATCAQV